MTGAIILNGISRNKKKFYQEIYPAISQALTVRVFETEYKGHASLLARNAVKDQFDFIIAAGGDGTINQVINGVMGLDSSVKVPSLGVIPLGTGNDFARACGATSDPKQLIGLVLNNQKKPTDIGKLISRNIGGEEVTYYFMNCCSLGMGPEVVQRMEKMSGKYGAAHSYMKAIISTFFKQRPPGIRCTSGAWSFQGTVRVLGIANGKSFGNGVYLAPDASIDDGLLNIFIALDVITIKFLLYIHLLKAKKKLQNSSCIYHAVTSISITSEEVCALETDGELAGYLPAEVVVLPGKINFFRQ